MPAGRKPTLKPSEAMELRLMREAGVSVKDGAAFFGVSVATAMRALASLRQKLGPEKFGNNSAAARMAGQRARSHLFVNSDNSQNLTPNNQ